VSERTAAYYLTATLVALAVGRFATTPLMKYISPSKLLGIYGAANVLLIGLAIVRPGMLGAYAIVATGFFLSIMFPTIFALGLKGLGPNTKLAGSLLVMAIVGGALFPLVLGYIARSTGSLAMGYIVPLCGFGVVSLYGFAAPWILPPSGNTDPEAGMLVAEYGQGV
jgi:FHS family L-fucose permease-like MFS transporter